MKKMILRLMVPVLCLALCGCMTSQGQATDPAQTQGQSQPPASAGDLNDRPITFPTQPTVPGEPVDFGATGAVRVTYSVNISSVRYVTSVGQLPDNEALKQYDEAYFETGALVLVMETVSSAAVQVGISDIRATEDAAWVTLSHETESDVTIPAMTTWLIWAEVERDLPDQWTVVNPALESVLENS